MGAQQQDKLKELREIVEKDQFARAQIDAIHTLACEYLKYKHEVELKDGKTIDVEKCKKTLDKILEGKKPEEIAQELGVDVKELKEAIDAASKEVEKMVDEILKEIEKGKIPTSEKEKK